MKNLLLQPSVKEVAKSSEGKTSYSQLQDHLLSLSGQMRCLVQCPKHNSTPSALAANLPHQGTPSLLSLGRSSLAPGRSGNQWSPRDPEASAAESSALLLREKREIFMSISGIQCFAHVNLARPRQFNKQFQDKKNPRKQQWKCRLQGTRSKHISKQISLTCSFLI